jgi:hypothetical protein
MDWHELAKKKVTELRELGHEKGMQGTSAMTKDVLVEKLAELLGIDKPHLVADGEEKAKIKAKIRELKVKRQEALEAGDRVQLKRARRKINRLKRRIRRNAHLAR